MVGYSLQIFISYIQNKHNGFHRFKKYAILYIYVYKQAILVIKCVHDIISLYRVYI